MKITKGIEISKRNREVGQRTKNQRGDNKMKITQGTENKPRLTIKGIDGSPTIPDLSEGMSLRDALSILRAYPWGALEDGLELILSDGSIVRVELVTFKDGSCWAGTQRAVRYQVTRSGRKEIKVYKIHLKPR